MKKKLIVSMDTYSWIKTCAGMVSKHPKIFDIIIVCTDDKRPMLHCKKLCSDAIYAQRSHDLFRIGKELGIKKMMNLCNCPDSISIEQLATQLQLHIAMSGIGSVYYQYGPLLTSMIEKFRELMSIDVYFYNSLTIPDHSIERVEVHLNNEELNKKLALTEYMVGIGNQNELPYWDKRETFYKKG